MGNNVDNLRFSVDNSIKGVDNLLVLDMRKGFFRGYMIINITPIRNIKGVTAPAVQST
jgi:hypothetical protein